MRTIVGTVIVLLAVSVIPCPAQETPDAMVDAYDSLADTILALRDAERDFVRSVLDGHLHAAKTLKEQGQWEAVAAQMALFANEGDNSIGGVRKKLLEGGHHFNAAGEEEGIYEPGYVVVTREAKRKALAASQDLRQAEDDEARTKAWKEFKEIAKGLLKKE